MSNRYDALREKIDREFSRSSTVEPDFAAGESATLINLDDHSDTFAISDRFEKYGPFNSLFVSNEGPTAVRVYVNPARTAYVTVGAGGAEAVLQRIPARYVRYLRVENLDGTTANNDVSIQVGNTIDSVELDLLKMAGQLDVQGY